MKKFLDEDFLLHNRAGQRLYHEYAKEIPIIDFHSHLPPDQIATDVSFKNITEAWLNGDHYKWRAMRTNGVDESFCTGNQSDFRKFEQWAATVPYTMRSPLYHWTHLELQRYFGIHDLLDLHSAKKIFESTGALLQGPDYSVRNLLRKMNVEVICTTDDPVSDLEHHARIQRDGFEIKVLPTFRPDRAAEVSNAARFNDYVDRLESVSNVSIGSYKDFLKALKLRHDYFASKGCNVSDHGIAQMHLEEYTEKEIESIFSAILSGHNPSQEAAAKFQSALLFQFAIWDWEKGWVQQFHLGALRNNNSRQTAKLGSDTGWDSIGDSQHAAPLARFLDSLDCNNQLTKTILYNLNPADNELMASMTGNFNDGSIAGKIQYGSAWWFQDQKDGMTRQINALSHIGLLSRFVGMLTDSRSFLSFPRHEYFRRLLCNIFGEEIERGELPADIPWIGKIVGDICYYNAKSFFNW